MKKLIAIAVTTIGIALISKAQTSVALPPVLLSEGQVTALTYFWKQYTNAFDVTNGVPLGKAEWFRVECTNLVMQAVDRRTRIYSQLLEARLRDIYATNATKRAAIEAILTQ